MKVKYKYNKRPMIMWYGKLFYGCGNMGNAFISSTMTGFISFFGMYICHVPAFVMGLAVSVGTLWDAVNDPVMGYMTDRARSAMFGKRHGFIMMGVFIAAVCNILLWSVPLSLGVAGKFFWFLLCILVLQTGMTLFDAPYNALGVDLSGDYHEQTRIQTYKSVFFLLGTIGPTLIMFLLQINPSPGYSDGRFDPSSYLNMAYISSIIMLICGFITYMGTYSHIPRLNKKAQLMEQHGAQPGAKDVKTVVRSFFQILKDRNFSAIIVGYSLAMMASAFLTSVGLNVFTYTFRLSAFQMYLLLGSLFVATILSQPLWAFLGIKMDKKPALITGIGIMIAGVCTIFAVFLSRNGILPDTEKLVRILLPAVVVTGIGVGALYPLPFSMMSDAIAYASVKEKEDKTATFSAFMTFAFKISQAAALFLIGTVMGLMGFNSAEGEVFVPSPAAEAGVGYLFCIGVLAAMVAALVVFARYRLKSTDIPTHEHIRTPSFEVDRLLSVMESGKKGSNGTNGSNGKNGKNKKKR